MLETSQNNELPAIPGKRYFTIGEVSTLCDV
ncbi:MAG: MerR family transcriptional regulator, partial [Pseudomonadota bacterium]